MAPLAHATRSAPGKLDADSPALLYCCAMSWRQLHASAAAVIASHGDRGVGWSEASGLMSVAAVEVGLATTAWAGQPRDRRLLTTARGFRGASPLPRWTT